mgnify:CR=1 FL=1
MSNITLTMKSYSGHFINIIWEITVNENLANIITLFVSSICMYIMEKFIIAKSMCVDTMQISLVCGDVISFHY